MVGATTAVVRQSLRGFEANVGLRFRPGAAGGVLGWPVRELPAEGVALDEICGRSVRSLEARLGGEFDTDRRRRMLEALIGWRIDAGWRPDPFVTEAAALLDWPDATVSAVAEAVGFSTRELRRRFHDHVGYGPKALQRVRRFQRLLRLLRREPRARIGLARVAADAGYADEAHMGRECRAICGCSPSRLIARRG